MYNHIPHEVNWQDTFAALESKRATGVFRLTVGGPMVLEVFNVPSGHQFSFAFRRLDCLEPIDVIGNVVRALPASKRTRKALRRVKPRMLLGVPTGKDR